MKIRTAAVREVKRKIGLMRVCGAVNKKLAASESDKYIELIPPVGINRHRKNLAHEHGDDDIFRLVLQQTKLFQNMRRPKRRVEMVYERGFKENGPFTEYKIYAGSLALGNTLGAQM